jgi:DNA-binding response OmpR family regulator
MAARLLDREIAMPQKKILAVDDSRTALMMTTMALRGSPHLVITAMDGEEALAKAMADPPDLIVLDVVMPKLDGLETCRRLRRHPPTKDIPIIMLTTRGEKDNVTNGVDAGCTEYLTKPVNVTELMARVRAYLGE